MSLEAQWQVFTSDDNKHDHQTVQDFIELTNISRTPGSWTSPIRFISQIVVPANVNQRCSPTNKNSPSNDAFSFPDTGRDHQMVKGQWMKGLSIHAINPAWNRTETTVTILVEEQMCVPSNIIKANKFTNSNARESQFIYTCTDQKQVHYLP